MENIITVEHVTKRFGQATVLNDINVSFEKGKDTWTYRKKRFQEKQCL